MSEGRDVHRPLRQAEARAEDGAAEDSEGAFAAAQGLTYTPLDFGLEIMLDGIDDLMRRQVSAEEPAESG